MTRLSIRHSSSPVAGRLRVAQAESGLTNEELAREIGVGLRLLQKWRAGTVEPRYENLQKLAAVLKREVSWFYAVEAADTAPDESRAA